MDNITKHLPFVKEQIEVQDKLAKRYGSQGEQWRENLHLLSLERFKALYIDLEQAEKYLKDLESRAKSPISTNKQLNLSYEEIQGLPEELVNELSFSEADKTEFTIRNIIEDAGGIASLDRILVELYKKTGEICKRTALTNRLYRMSNKGLIHSVAGKKGVYSVTLIDETEANHLINSHKGVGETIDDLI